MSSREALMIRQVFINEEESLTRAGKYSRLPLSISWPQTFHNFESQNQDIWEFYVTQKLRSTDLEAAKIEKWSVGIVELSSCNLCVCPSASILYYVLEVEPLAAALNYYFYSEPNK